MDGVPLNAAEDDSTHGLNPEPEEEAVAAEPAAEIADPLRDFFEAHTREYRLKKQIEALKQEKQRLQEESVRRMQQLTPDMPQVRRTRDPEVFYTPAELYPSPVAEPVIPAHCPPAYVTQHNLADIKQEPTSAGVRPPCPNHRPLIVVVPDGSNDDDGYVQHFSPTHRAPVASLCSQLQQHRVSPTARLPKIDFPTFDGNPQDDPARFLAEFDLAAMAAKLPMKPCYQHLLPNVCELVQSLGSWAWPPRILEHIVRVSRSMTSCVSSHDYRTCGHRAPASYRAGTRWSRRAVCA